MKKVIPFIILVVLMGACNNNTPKELISVDVTKVGAPVAPSMYGIFFEEINNAGDGGLYAELVRNRSFEELELPDGYRAEGDRLIPKQVTNHTTGRIEQQTFKWTNDPVPGWSLAAESNFANMEVTKEKPHFKTAPNNLKVTVKNASKPIQVINSGYWGMNAVKGDAYKLRLIVRLSNDYKGTVIVRFISKEGEELASSELKDLKIGQWNDVSKKLVSSGNDPKAKLSIELNSTGTVWFDYVSLFPEKTFINRKNGLRKDVAEFLVGLQPSFVRWPGGCVVEGISLENRYEWKKTLGDPAARPGEYSLWGYGNTYGFGYYEFLQYCEDINADGMFVCNVGIGCQYRMGDACSNNEVDYYLDDCLDAIEYAIGDASTEWGAKRAAHGHPEPFPLKYIEIGNENRGELYEERFDIFYKAIKEKYPELVLISNHGTAGTGKIEQTDMVDPHWYVAPDFFFGSTTIFDNLERGKYTVYVGEYAVNNGVGAGNMTAALSEAAFITGMERNGDIVTMTSYAPLLENRNNRCWATNLIWLDTDQVLGRSSYYVQKMAAENKPDYNVELSNTMTEAKPASIPQGGVGVGTWVTHANFRNAKITTETGDVIKLNLNESSFDSGNWTVENGILSQTSMSQATLRIFEGFSGNNYSFEFEGKKIEGKEGFFVYFGMHNKNQDGFAFNLGGWDNTNTAVQRVAHGRTSSQIGNSVSQTIESGKWYNIKLIVRGDRAELHVDGKFILAYENVTTPMQFYAAGYDEESQEIILKVVNADSTLFESQIVLKGVSEVEKAGKVVTLSTDNPNNENSFEEPNKIYPVDSGHNGFGKKFDYSFEPYSFTILRIKATK